MKSGLSVIICCYNSEQRIGKVLGYIGSQENMDGIDWEVIVVDNASRDRTSEVARKSWDRRNIDFQVVHEAKPGLSNARIRGLQTAVYDIIVFVDDDNLLEKDYLLQAFKLMKDNPGVGLAGGYGTAISDVKFPPWFHEYGTVYAVGEQAVKPGILASSRPYLHGAGLVMRKEAWDYLINNGFTFILSGRKGKSLSSGEDSEISSAMRFSGYELWYEPSLKFKHIISEERINWKYVRQLAKQFGKSSVIIDVYNTELRNLKGLQKLRTHSWIIGLLSSLLKILRLLPAYIYSNAMKKESDLNQYDFLYEYGYLLQRVSMAGSFNRTKNEIIKLKERLSKNRFL
jgi:glycosyltransferase involved in cell wall biosynthesis